MEQKINELLDVMDDKDLDVISVSETKRKGNDTTDLPGNRAAFWAGVTEGERGCQGVGVLLSSLMVYVLVEYKAINLRLLWVCFKLGITRVFLLAVYSLISSAPVSELEEFWESVRDVLSSVRDSMWRYEWMGWNHWSGYESVQGKYGEKRVNEAGKLILEFCPDRKVPTWVFSF